MITVTAGFTTDAQAGLRDVDGDIDIDWDLDGTFTNEKAHLVLIEYERKVNEPLGGISIALGDIVLTNYDDRYTPPTATS